MVLTEEEQVLYWSLNKPNKAIARTVAPLKVHQNVQVSYGMSSSYLLHFTTGRWTFQQIN